MFSISRLLSMQMERDSGMLPLRNHDSVVIISFPKFCIGGQSQSAWRYVVICCAVVQWVHMFDLISPIMWILCWAVLKCVKLVLYYLYDYISGYGEKLTADLIPNCIISVDIEVERYNCIQYSPVQHKLQTHSPCICWYLSFLHLWFDIQPGRACMWSDTLPVKLFASPA